MFGVGGAHSSTAIECMLIFGLQLHSDVASGPRFMHRAPCRPFCHLRVLFVGGLVESPKLGAFCNTTWAGFVLSPEFASRWAGCSLGGLAAV